MCNNSKLCLALIDLIFIILITVYIFVNFTVSTPVLIGFVTVYSLLTLFIMYKKGVYSQDCKCKTAYKLFEAIVLSSVFVCIPLTYLSLNLLTVLLFVLCSAVIFVSLILLRAICCVISKIRKPKNVLIVGAGQDGTLMAEVIQTNPKSGLRVVGFLDDNMNTIEDEDATIPILGLTCDSEAVIKENNVKVVIISVKSQMDSAILTDLVKGIPMGVKVVRMPKLYGKFTKKYLISKLSVNNLFYECVQKRAILYANIKRFADIISSLAILIVTSPIWLVASVGIKLSDLGPIFFTQTRIGKFGKPFKMIKFRTMYQDKVEDNFDDDIDEVVADDKRIMPFCRILRKFHIDELPQMFNILKGEMSLVGPRPVREEVYYENKHQIPFWECRNWVRPGWCGWQQINSDENTIAEDRLSYDLYYIKHRNVIWEIWIFINYVIKVICGKG